MAKRSSIRSKMYSFGSFAQFIRATGPASDTRLKYWAPRYHDVPRTLWENLCLCTHKLTSHRWELGLVKWVITPMECLKKNCRCGLGCQSDNLKYIENLK
jgi:hypothetical protein